MYCNELTERDNHYLIPISDIQNFDTTQFARYFPHPISEKPCHSKREKKCHITDLTPRQINNPNFQPKKCEAGSPERVLEGRSQGGCKKECTLHKGTSIHNRQDCRVTLQQKKSPGMDTTVCTSIEIEGAPTNLNLRLYRTPCSSELFFSLKEIESIWHLCEMNETYNTAAPYFSNLYKTFSSVREMAKTRLLIEERGSI
ncbi:MAG: hypothetical protein LBU99_07055 [Spirochaetaceae bacterium]|jgi:hypothetical protein|nr:hypothetical protein [Spirochaetaceae bacterium]